MPLPAVSVIVPSEETSLPELLDPEPEESAESFGVKGYLISDRNQLQNELKNALDHDGPALINILVRRGENCYPMVPPGKSNAQMVGYVNCED